MIRQIKSIANLNIISELKTFPNQGILWEIVEEKQTGKIFELPDNAVLIMENCLDPFVFIAGTLTDKAIDNILPLLEKCKFPMIYCSPRYHPLFLARGWNFHLRTELHLKSIVNNTTKQNNYNYIRPIESIEIFKQCLKHKKNTKLYGSEQNFMTHGTGFALFLDSNKLVAEAYASIGGGYAEIDAITHPNYRGKGYATQVISHLIKQCLNKEITPQWSCNVDNTPSLNTGLKLGFEINNYYTLLVPDCGNVLCPNLVKWLEKNPYP